MPLGATVGGASWMSLVQRWARASLPSRVLTNSKSVSSFLLVFLPLLPVPSSRLTVFSQPRPALSLFSHHSHPLLFWQVGSEMAISGEAVSQCFEEKLRGIFPGQTFPETPEADQALETNEKEDDTEDSDDDFVQPKRKRLKTEEKILHIKWKQAPKLKQRDVTRLSSSCRTCPLRLRQQSKRPDLLHQLAWFISSLLWKESLSTTKTFTFFRTLAHRNVTGVTFPSHSGARMYRAWSRGCFEVGCFFFLSYLSFVNLLWRLLYTNSENPFPSPDCIICIRTWCLLSICITLWKCLCK